jgi:hypothetical protein
VLVLLNGSLNGGRGGGGLGGGGEGGGGDGLGGGGLGGIEAPGGGERKLHAGEVWALLYTAAIVGAMFGVPEGFTRPGLPATALYRSMKDCRPSVVFMRARYVVAHATTEDCAAPEAVSNASVNLYRQGFAKLRLSHTFASDIGSSAVGAPVSTADVEFKQAATPLQAKYCI